nr:RNA-directed DNA polymerase, eukaryota, reverse transcriptase zinc-binding domain protein [Tanacetum cinerariifolium]
GCLNFDFPFHLNDEQNSVLELPVTREEIRIVVWGCGEDKSPGLDGFTFEFFRIKIDSSFTLSHLFYADDAVFIGEWSNGGNMSLVKEWDESIAKLKKKLSKWKLKTLSVGGRLTLLKAVLGSTPIYNISLFKAPK